MGQEAPQLEVTEIRDDELVESIGVALSGGGSRAALYSLGVLIYLVHAGLNDRVRLISSVSGGSIVNAALSLTKDYSRLSSEEFDEIAGVLASRLANIGVFFLPATSTIINGLFLGLVTVLVLTMASFTLALAFTRESIGASFRGSGIPGVETLITGLAIVAVFTIIIWSRRGRMQRARYKRLMNEIKPGGKTFRSVDQLRLINANSETRVRHILCATELTSGRPIYMDRHEIRSPAYGSGEPNLSFAQAIYASAAFPVVFPPLRLKTASLNMSGGDTEERPAELLLSDGGVFNNLGTESFTAWNIRDPFIPDPQFVKLPQISRRIVVNASSPGRVASMPRLWIWRNVAAIQRIMAVLYENTLRPRIDKLIAEESLTGDPLVIDISNSPIDILNHVLERQPKKDDEEYKRAQETVGKLKDFQSVAYWHEYSRRASSTKTDLRAIGKTAAVRLLRLGYLDATITCHIHLNSQGVNGVPPEDWFQALVKGSKKKHENPSPR
jgi:predicted acylesterase/phospholipase RssA